MVRSTKLSLKFTNLVHRQKLCEFVDEYRRVAVIAAQKLWDQGCTDKFVIVKALELDTWLSVRAQQSCCKQVMAVIYGTRKSRQATRSTETACPDVSKIVPSLDPRLVKLSIGGETTFDAWLSLESLCAVSFKKLGFPSKLRFPVKFTEHYNRFTARGGRMASSVNISKTAATLVFHFDDPEPAQGQTIGIDVGITAPATLSRSSAPLQHPHGWTYSKVLSTLSRRKKGSKNFRQAQALRDNFIGWWINRLDLTGVSTANLENIYDMRRGRRVDRFRGHWNYPYIFRKLESRCAELGVRIQYIDQAYTSQQCSACGAVDSESRRGAEFCCTTCCHTANSDFNAAINIERRAALQPWRGAYSPSCNESTSTEA